MGIQQQVSVSPATDEDRTIATITTAFNSDPAARWVFRGASRYLTFWPPFVKAFAGGAFANGTADSIDDYGGVAMWLPPGAASDEETLVAIVVEGVPAGERDEVLALLDQMGHSHPTGDHWYLPLMGVDVTSQNRGYGSALLRHALERCDNDQLPAYLEATTPRNKALYGRHGFEELGVIQTGSSPPLWPMQRNPH